MKTSNMMFALVTACALGITGSAVAETLGSGRSDGYQPTERNAEAGRQNRREQRRFDGAEDRRSRRPDRVGDTRRDAGRAAVEDRRSGRGERRADRTHSADRHNSQRRSERYSAVGRRDADRYARWTGQGNRRDFRHHDVGHARGDRRKQAHSGRWSDHRSYGKDRRFDNRIDRRLSDQRARTRAGWKNGDITHRELKRIRQDRRKVARMDQRFGSDGRYTKHERRKLNKAIDRAGNRIYRAKHNDRMADAGRSHRR